MPHFLFYFAAQELTIENEIKKLADVWREQRFELGKYMKVRMPMLINGLGRWLM